MPPEVRIDLPRPRVTLGEVLTLVAGALVLGFLVAVAYFIAAVGRGSSQ